VLYFLAFVAGVVAGSLVTIVFAALWLVASAEREDPWP
jgi:hypothetical protein